MQRHDGPGDEAIAALAEGRLRGDERDQVLRHLAGCDECRAVFSATAEFLAADGAPFAATASAPVLRGRFGRRGGWVAALVAAAVVVGLFMPLLQSRRAFDAMLEQTASLEFRTTESRLSIDLPYRPLPPVMRGASDGSGTTAELDRAAVEVIERSERFRARSLDRRRAAQACLLVGNPDEAISILENSGPDRDAGSLIDLSAAYLARHAKTGVSQDAMMAERYAEQAWAAGQSLAAGWNRALATEAAKGREAAAPLWREYLARDSSSRWAAEARTHLDQGR